MCSNSDIVADLAYRAILQAVMMLHCLFLKSQLLDHSKGLILKKIIIIIEENHQVAPKYKGSYGW